jgi:signal peptidase I
MIRPPHLLRTGLISAALVVLAVAGWLLLAPTQIGGETGYVTTSGISMAPRFHSGDLAIVRPKAEYRVGDVIAYHSKTLHLVVLHRIVAMDNGRYVTRGDNNDFTDPDHPSRADVLGKLAVRVPHGGHVLHFLHTPFMAALLAGGMALLLFVGNKRRRRRRDRRRPLDERGVRPLEPVAPARDRKAIYDFHEQTIFTTCAVVALVFLAFGALAFTRPATKPIHDKTPYTEKVAFGYHAKAAPGAVYPDGVVSTGDPIFIKLVRRVRVKAHYRLDSAAAHRLGGTMEVVLRLTSPTGWSRTIQLAAPKRFTGDYAAADVTLDIPRLRSLIREVEKATGGTTGSAYTLEVTPRVHVAGTLASQPITSDYEPALKLQLDALKLRPNATAPTPDAAASGSDPAEGTKSVLHPSRPGSVTASRTEANDLTVHDIGLPVPTARWIAIIGLLLGVAGTLFTGAGLVRDPHDPTENVQRYRHLIVPIAAPTYDPTRPPIDVTSIGALAQLAERSERLILHHQADGVDTYLVDDEGTLYRYQAASNGVPRTPLSLVDERVLETAGR